MRLVFISSVTAMTPLRTTSAITGSSRPRFVRSVPICLVVFRAIALLPAGAVYVARMERRAIRERPRHISSAYPDYAFGARRGSDGAVAQQMHVVEMALNGGAVLFFEQPRRQFDCHGMLLADIAHVRGAVHRYLFGRHRGGGDGAPAFAFEFVVDAGEIVKRRILQPGWPGAHVVIAQV